MIGTASLFSSPAGTAVAFWSPTVAYYTRSTDRVAGCSNEGAGNEALHGGAEGERRSRGRVGRRAEPLAGKAGAVRLRRAGRALCDGGLAGARSGVVSWCGDHRERR